MDSTAELLLEAQHSQILNAQSLIFEAANDTLQNQQMLMNNQMLIGQMITNMNLTLLVTSFYVSLVLVCLFVRLDAQLPQQQVLVESPDSDHSYKELA